MNSEIENKETDAPKISIIVPVYNVEQYLQRCLDSIAAQTFTDWECILIDDGSPDNSGAICDEYAAKDERFKVIHQKNAGVSAARNAGLEVAKGEWIGFVDPDDYIQNDMYSFLYSLAHERNADIVCCGWDNYEGATVETQIFKPLKEKFKKPYFNDVINSREAIIRELSHAMYITWDKLFSKKVCHNVFYNTKYVNGEDRLFTVQSFLNATLVAYNMLPKYHYCHRPNSAGTKAFTKKDYTLLLLCKEIKEICANVSKDAYKAANHMENQAFIQLLNMIEKSPKSNDISKEYEKKLIRDCRKKLFNILNDNFAFRTKVRVFLLSLFPYLGLSASRFWHSRYTNKKFFI